MAPMQSSSAFLFINKDVDSIKITPAESFEIASHLSKAQWREERRKKLEAFGPVIPLTARDASTAPGRNRCRQIPRIRRPPPAIAKKEYIPEFEHAERSHTEPRCENDDQGGEGGSPISTATIVGSEALCACEPLLTTDDGPTPKNATRQVEENRDTRDQQLPQDAITLRANEPDPFETFPVKSKPYTQNVIRFWMEDILPKASVSHFACLQLIWNSAVLFEAYQAYGLQMMTTRMPSAPRTVLNHKTECLSLLNRLMPAQPLDDATITAICTIVALDMAASNMHHYAVHINGLREVVRVRGGFDAISIVTRNNIIAAEMFGGLWQQPRQDSPVVVSNRQGFLHGFGGYLGRIATIYGIKAPPSTSLQRLDEVQRKSSTSPSVGVEQMSTTLEWSTFVDICFQMLVAVGAVEGSYQHLVRFNGKPRKLLKQVGNK